MCIMTRLANKLITSFGVWEEARPYLSMIVTDREMELIIGLAAVELVVRLRKALA